MKPALIYDDLPKETRHLVERRHKVLMGENSKPLAGLLRLLAIHVERGELDTELLREDFNLIGNSWIDKLMNDGETFQFGNEFFNIRITDQAFAQQQPEDSGLAESRCKGEVCIRNSLVITRIKGSK